MSKAYSVAPSHPCRIELQHIRGHTKARKDWCLNNFFAFCGPNRLETDKESLYHKWMAKSSSISINVHSSVTSIAFSSQDATEILVTVHGASHGKHAPLSPIPVIHWSNDSHRNGGEWTCKDNNRKEHWSYTVVHISHNPSSHFSSWSSLNPGATNPYSANIEGFAQTRNGMNPDYVPIAQSYTPQVVEAYAVPMDGSVPVLHQMQHEHSMKGAVNAAVNEIGCREFLRSERWPVGLQDTLINNMKRIPIRFFICDDSGSMCTNDGNKIWTSRYEDKFRSVPCTRWSELTHALDFHMQLSRAASAPCEFRMLNSCVPLMMGNGGVSDEVSYTKLKNAFNIDAPPIRGGTPLCRHISEVIQKIKAMEQQLNANRQRACLIIASNGESSDGDVAAAMAPLKQLPVWVVIRLCTDDDRVVDYWNNIDSQLELDMDVLHDLHGEASEVRSANKWLTYGLPIQRMRCVLLNEEEFFSFLIYI